MRIVTRPDFDGIVCAALIYDVENITKPIKWAAPNDMQKGLVEVKHGDIIANLPYNPNCSLWFDHHFSNKIDTPFNGNFRITPSAARIVYEYYKDKLKKDYKQLIKEADKIDSADLSIDEVRYPEKYPYIILSLTIFSHIQEEELYWNLLVGLLRESEIDGIMQNKEVLKRTEQFIEENHNFQSLLLSHTKMEGAAAITDFRSFDKIPRGNRFLVYSLFPESVIHVSISYDDNDKNQIVIRAGYNIFNKKCNVNVGELFSNFEGGGHKAVGSCRFDISMASEYLPKILTAFIENKKKDLNNNDWNI